MAFPTAVLLTSARDCLKEVLTCPVGVKSDLKEALAGCCLKEALACCCLKEALAGCCLKEALAGCCLKEALAGCCLKEALAGCCLKEALACPESELCCLKVLVGPLYCLKEVLVCSAGPMGARLN